MKKYDQKWFVMVAIMVGILTLVGCGSMEMKKPEYSMPEKIDSKDINSNLEDKVQVEDSKEKVSAAKESKNKEEETESIETKDSQQKQSVAENSEDQKEDQKDTKDQAENSKKDLEPVANTPIEVKNQFSNQEEYNPDIKIDSLSNQAQSWSFKRNSDHTPVQAYTKIDLSKYGSYYLGNKTDKVVYLTFDEGYENGFTPTILDVLQQKQVKAAFFITGSYLKRNPELVKRMKAEGHVVGNHSQNHPDFTTKTDEEVISEVTQVGDQFKQVIGQEIDPFFRFPSGRYSERDLYLVRKLGYRSIFWSMAYKDWEVDNQPGKAYARNHVMENYHPGSIILLHAVSSSNTQALADIITDIDEAGYRFGSLYELE